MGSVYEEISRLETAKSDIEMAIESCGVLVPNTDLIDTYASYIRQIPSAIFSSLNVNSAGGMDQYIQSIEQTNGLISTTVGGLVSDSRSGLVPKICNDDSDAITSIADEWVLTSNKGNTPTWKKLPSDCIITFNPTSISLTKDWVGTGFVLSEDKFTTGVYAIKITSGNLIFAGTASVFVGKITVDDEIVLHMSGIPQSFRDGTQGRIYAKIAPSQTSDYGEIYLSTNVPQSDITNLSITMKKLI